MRYLLCRMSGQEVALNGDQDSSYDLRMD
jgi:hypothetical protein